jgi:hypothetical protein
MVDPELSKLVGSQPQAQLEAFEKSRWETPSIPVYRGRNEYFYDRPKDEQDLQKLGHHWSYSPDVARHFGAGLNDNDIVGEQLDHEGHVIKGLVAPKDIIRPGTSEHEYWEKNHRVVVMPPKRQADSEREATIRPNSPIKVVGMEIVKHADTPDKKLGFYDNGHKVISQVQLNATGNTGPEEKPWA